MAQKVAFLDRDGTLNVDYGFVHRFEEWQFTVRAPEAVKLLRDAGFFVAVVTNQSGVAAGYYDEDDVRSLHAFAQEQLKMFDTKIDAFAYCPHARDSTCQCRKPRTTMAAEIQKDIDEPIDYATSWTIGDKISDIEFGRSLGTHTAIIRSRYWTDEELTLQPEIIADSLHQATQIIVRER